MEIVQGIFSLIVMIAYFSSLFVIGLIFCMFAVYFLYAMLWWFPLIFLGGLISGDIFKKDDLEFLSPFVILQIAFPKNIKLTRIYALCAAALSFFGTYQFFNNENIYIAAFAMFIGAATIFGVVYSFKNKSQKS